MNEKKLKISPKVSSDPKQNPKTPNMRIWQFAIGKTPKWFELHSSLQCGVAFLNKNKNPDLQAKLGATLLYHWKAESEKG